jgi:hypothetical protein
MIQLCNKKTQNRRKFSILRCNLIVIDVSLEMMIVVLGNLNRKSWKNLSLENTLRCITLMVFLSKKMILIVWLKMENNKLLSIFQAEVIYLIFESVTD